MTAFGVNAEVRFLTKRWEHHSTHSGYDQLISRLGKSVPLVNSQRLLEKLIPGRLAVGLAERSGHDLYSYLNFYAEWSAMREMFSHNRKPIIYHLLYADDTYRYLGWIGKRRNIRLVATYHLPPSALKDILRTTDFLKRLDAIVVVGRNQRSFFEPIVGPEKVFFVPHGIDVNIFSPEAHDCLSAVKQKKRCIFVGIHRRDIQTLRQVIEIVSAKDKEIEFVIVTSQYNASLLPSGRNIKIMCGVPESELVKLYCSSSLLLQTLEDSTANNAILEGLACGLPVIATDIGAVRDYVDGSSGILVSPHSAESMAGAVMHLLNEPELRAQMSISARNQALKFDWTVIAEQMQQVYQHVLKN